MRVNKAYGQGFAIFLALITVKSAALTVDHYLFLHFIRTALLASAGIMTAYLAMTFITRSANAAVLIPLFMHVVLVVWGLLMSMVFGGFSFFNAINTSSLILSFFATITFAGVMQQTKYGKDVITNNSILRVYFILQLIVVFILAFFQEGFPYYLSFQVSSEAKDFYSQGFTHLFSLSLIFFAFAAFSKSKINLFYLGASILSFVLMILGGARGEVIIAVFVLILFSLRQSRFHHFAFGCLCLALLMPVLAANVDLDKIVLVERFLVMLDGDFGSRDKLLFSAMNVLAAEPVCFAIGCGFNYFENYYGYHEPGSYPHITIVEMVISFGIFVTTITVLLVLIKLSHLYFSPNTKGALVPIIAYELLRLQKSGSILDPTCLSVLVVLAYQGGQLLARSTRKAEIH